MSNRASGLLTAMSTVFIILGCLELIGGLLTANIGGLVAIAGAGAGSSLLVTLGVLIITLSLIVGVSDLISGILTLRRRGLGFAMFVTVATIVVAVVFLFVFLLAGAHVSAVILTLITLVLAVLYLISVVQVKYPR